MTGMDVIVGGLHVRGSDVGRGPVALLLHGWNSDHKTMLGLRKVLPGMRIIVPDLPGFGGTQPPNEVWGVDGYAEFVLKLLDKISVSDVDVVIGHSFGGRIALELVGSGKLTPEKLVLLASHGLPEKRTLGNRLVGLLANVGRVLPVKWRSAVGRRWRSEDYQAAVGVMAPTFLKVISQDATATASRIKTNTLLVYGQEDQTTPPSMGRRFNRLIVGSQLKLVEQAGHYVHLDQPERTGELIKGFLK